jgi:hypothetical protein
MMRNLPSSGTASSESAVAQNDENNKEAIRSEMRCEGIGVENIMR